MKTILLPTDFSANARNALHFVSKLYSNQDVNFILFHAYKFGTDSANKNMEEEVERATSKYEINVTGVIKKGSLIDEVNIAISSYKVDVIVMGTQGASGLKEKVFGSNTVSVIDAVDIPVWVIPQESRFWKFEETIFCADYEDLVYSKTLRYYKELIVENKALLKLLHIKTGESNSTVHKEHISESTELRAYFLPEIEPKSRCVNANDVEKGINWYLKKHPEIDALAVVNHKRNFMANLFNNNRTHQLTFHSKTPLLVLQDI